MAKVINFDRSINWETDICEECWKGTPCLLDEKPCLPLEMLRQLVQKNPGEQVQDLLNLKDRFIYERKEREPIGNKENPAKKTVKPPAKGKTNQRKDITLQ